MAVCKGQGGKRAKHGFVSFSCPLRQPDRRRKTPKRAKRALVSAPLDRPGFAAACGVARDAAPGDCERRERARVTKEGKLRPMRPISAANRRAK